MTNHSLKSLVLALAFGWIVIILAAPDARSQTAPSPTSRDWPELDNGAKFPEFKIRVTGDAYTKALKVATDLIPHPPYKGLPIFGIRITKVQYGQAQKLGWHVGDIVTKLDDHRICVQREFVHFRTQAPQQVTVWSSKGGSRVFTIQPGKVGILATNYWNAGLDYLSTLRKGEKPNPYIMAATQCATNYPLEETLLAKAQQAGTKNPMFYILAEMLESEQGYYDQAIVCGRVAVQQCRDADVFTVASWMKGPAMATCRYKLAQRLDRQFPGCFQTTPSGPADTMRSMQELVADFPAPPKTPNLGQSLFSTLPNVNDVLRSATNDAAPGDDKAGSSQIVAEISHNKAFHFDIPAGQFSFFVMGPASPNVDCLLACHFVGADKKTQTIFARCVRFGITQEGMPNSYALQLTIMDSGQTTLRVKGMPAVSLDLAEEISNNKTFKLRVTATRKMCQVRINNRSIFYGPLADDQKTREYDFVGQFIGVKGAMHIEKWQTAGPNGL